MKATAIGIGSITQIASLHYIIYEHMAPLNKYAILGGWLAPTLMSLHHPLTPEIKFASSVIHTPYEKHYTY